MSGWDPEMLGALARLGLVPREDTPVELMRDHLNDLYRYELRRMRDVLRAGAMDKADYVPRVIELRKKYWPLSVRVDRWKDI